MTRLEFISKYLVPPQDITIAKRMNDDLLIVARNLYESGAIFTKEEIQNIQKMGRINRNGQTEVKITDLK